MSTLETVLVDNLWISLVIWLVLYIADYYLTLWGAHLYKSGVQEHIVYEGSYELTPGFQKDVDALKLVSLKFLRAVAVSIVIVVAMWYFARRPEGVQPFLFVFGALALRQIPVILRHATNIITFLRLRRHLGVTGCISYSRWLTLERSSLDMLGYGLVYLIAFLLCFKTSLLGGAVALFVIAIQHHKMSKKQRLESSQGRCVGALNPDNGGGRHDVLKLADEIATKVKRADQGSCQ